MTYDAPAIVRGPVVSGGTKKEDLARYAYRPDLVVSSLGEFSDVMEKAGWNSPWTSPRERFGSLPRELAGVSA